MQSAQDSNFEMSLRDQLIAAQGIQQPPPPPAQHMDQQPLPPGSEHYHQPHPLSPHQHRMDPNMGGQHMTPYGMPGDLQPDHQDMGADGKKIARRELSSSKRAAQNRAAQRAFRQRKEAYILKLEQQVKDYKVLEEDFRTLQQDNFHLRDHIAELETSLGNHRIDHPSAPPPVQLQNPNPIFLPMSMNDPEPTQDTTMQDEQQHYQQQDEQQQQQRQQQMAAAELRPFRMNFRDEGHRQQDMHEDDIDRQYHNAIANHEQLRQPAPPSKVDHASQAHDPLPPAAISQLQAAAAQADELEPSASSQSQAEPQYLPASEYPQKQPGVDGNEAISSGDIRLSA